MTTAKLSCGTNRATKPMNPAAAGKWLHRIKAARRLAGLGRSRSRLSAGLRFAYQNGLIPGAKGRRIQERPGQPGGPHVERRAETPLQPSSKASSGARMRTHMKSSISPPIFFLARTGMPTRRAIGRTACWVTFSKTAITDRQKGRPSSINEYLDSDELPDKIGFGGRVPQTEAPTNRSYGMIVPIPLAFSPGALRRASVQGAPKLAIPDVGRCRHNPSAHGRREYAILDNLHAAAAGSAAFVGAAASGGTITPMGINPPPARARNATPRRARSHSLAGQWDRGRGPFSHVGKHYSFRYVNSLARAPLSQEKGRHPPDSGFPSQGSGSTIPLGRGASGYTIARTREPPSRRWRVFISLYRGRRLRRRATRARHDHGSPGPE